QSEEDDGVSRLRSVRAAVSDRTQAGQRDVPDGVAGRRCRFATRRDTRARVARRRAGPASADRAAIRLARARDSAERRTVTAVADDTALDGGAQGRSASTIGSGA